MLITNTSHRRSFFGTSKSNTVSTKLTRGGVLIARDSATVGIVVVFLCRSLLQRGVWWIQVAPPPPRSSSL